MAEIINFTWMGITTEDLQLPGNIKDFTLRPEEEVSWLISFGFSLPDYPDSRRGLEIDLSYTMHYINDPEKKPIALLKIKDIFSVGGTATYKGKLDAIIFIMQIASWHLQGIYAARTRNTALSLVLPPNFDFSQCARQFKQQIKDEWS